MKRFQVSRWVSYKEYQYVNAEDIHEAERKAYRIKKWNETEHERCGSIDVTLAGEADDKMAKRRDAGTVRGQPPGGYKTDKPGTYRKTGE